MIKRFQKNFKTELTQTSRYGLIVLLGLLFFSASSKISQNTELLKQQYSSSSLELKSLQNLASGEVWKTRLEMSQKELANIRQGIWHGPTPGVVAAYLEESLMEVLSQGKVRNTNIEIDPVPVDLNGINVLPFELSGTTSHSTAISLLARLEESERLFWIDDLSLNFHNNSQSNFLISGYAPIKLGAENWAQEK